MAEFIRARSDEQKSQRMDDIKKATYQLFSEFPYHEITLTTIAARLGWSRANLYKYVATKEEIFLELAADARNSYYSELRDAFADSEVYGTDKAAEIWAKLSANHRDWPLFGTMLMTIIEQNVTVERLKVFKKGYYDQLAPLSQHFSKSLGVTEESFPALLNTVYYHETGLAGNCLNNPLVAQAVSELGIDRSVPDYQSNMQNFLTMCISYWKTTYPLN